MVDPAHERTPSARTHVGRHVGRNDGRHVGRRGGRHGGRHGGRSGMVIGAVIVSARRHTSRHTNAHTQTSTHANKHTRTRKVVHAARSIPCSDGRMSSSFCHTYVRASTCFSGRQTRAGSHDPGGAWGAEPPHLPNGTVALGGAALRDRACMREGRIVGGWSARTGEPLYTFMRTGCPGVGTLHVSPLLHHVIELGDLRESDSKTRSSHSNATRQAQ